LTMRAITMFFSREHIILREVVQWEESALS
jgi:hypothetical protein